MKNTGIQFFFAIAVALLFLHQAYATEIALQQRLLQVSQTLKTNSTDKINFIEERQSKILSAPAVFRGHLIFDADSGNMSKVITEPEAIVMTIEAKHMVLDQGGKTRRMSLRSRPGLRAFVSLFASLRNGDVNALRKHFALDYTEQSAMWRLVLTPEQKKLSKRLKSVSIQGEADLIKTITTTMKNDDSQTMEFIR